MTKAKYFLTFILIFSHVNRVFAHLDLETEMSQKYVIKSQKIDIEGYPYGFNPTMVKWRGGILMCFRAGKSYNTDVDCKPKPIPDPKPPSPPPPKPLPDPKPTPKPPNKDEEPSGDEPNKQNQNGVIVNQKGFASLMLEKASIDKAKDNTDAQDPNDQPSQDPDDEVIIIPPKPVNHDVTYSPNRFAFVWLDKNFAQISDVQLLDLPHCADNYRQQDPRLVTIGDKLYVVYSDMVPAAEIPLTRRMFFAELELLKGRFFVKKVDSVLHFAGEKDGRWEKNWVPFDYKKNLLLSYLINPHTVIKPIGKGCGQIFASTISDNLGWEWGELRGGTQAVLLNKDEYLAFFHSSTYLKTVQSDGIRMQHYFMGGYTFSSVPPFELKRISSAPIIGENYYNGRQYQTWKPLRVVFPCGFIMNDQYIWISYGRQDHEIWVTTLDKKEFLKTLKPVSN